MCQHLHMSIRIYIGVIILDAKKEIHIAPVLVVSLGTITIILHLHCVGFRKDSEVLLGLLLDFHGKAFLVATLW